MKPTPRVVLGLPLVASALACQPPSSNTGGLLYPDADAQVARDGGMNCAPPTVESMPSPDYPYRLFTLKGTARGARQVIITADAPGTTPTVAQLSETTTDYKFCADVPLPTDSARTFNLSLQALCANGVFSPVTSTTVSYRPGSAGSPLRTCNNGSPADCVPTAEICTDGMDNNCNGLMDGDDPACAACPDDPLEGVPGSSFSNNSPGSAAELSPGRYERLMICPGNQDYYNVYLFAGSRVTAQIDFEGGTGTKDLDLDLIRVADTNGLVTKSQTATTREVVSYTAPSPAAEGLYSIRVYSPYADTGSNYYTLTLQITSATPTLRDGG